MRTSLRQVFGVSTTQPLSYVERPHVDQTFKDALKAGNAIIVYGASKQGKTALVSRYLNYQENIVVRVTPATKTKDIYSSMLRQSGVEIADAGSISNTTETAAKLGSKAIAKAPLIADASAELESSVKSGTTRSSTVKRPQLNLELPQDVGEALAAANSRRVVILENFHYLPEQEQRLFAFDLRTFQEIGIRFVVLGVWREKNRLQQFNGDLVDRMTEVAVEPWTDPHLFMVAREGEKHLNLQFGTEFLRKCVQASFGSIGVFQEIMRGVCSAARIEVELKSEVRIEDEVYLLDSLKNRTQAYEQRHRQSLLSIASPWKPGNGNAATALLIAHHFVLSILWWGFPGLRDGISRSRLEGGMNNILKEIPPGMMEDLHSFLMQLGALQSEKGITPPIFSFDSYSDRLNIVDSTFYFYIKNANLESLSGDVRKLNQDRLSPAS